MTTRPFEITKSVPPPRHSPTSNERGEVFSALMALSREEDGTSFFVPCELDKCEALRKNIGVKMTKIRKMGPEYRDFFHTTEKRVEEVDGKPTQGVRIWKVPSAAQAPAGEPGEPA